MAGGNCCCCWLDADGEDNDNECFLYVKAQFAIFVLLILHAVASVFVTFVIVVLFIDVGNIQYVIYRPCGVTVDTHGLPQWSFNSSRQFWAAACFCVILYDVFCFAVCFCASTAQITFWGQIINGTEWFILNLKVCDILCGSFHFFIIILAVGYLHKLKKVFFVFLLAFTTKTHICSHFYPPQVWQWCSAL